MLSYLIKKIKVFLLNVLNHRFESNALYLGFVAGVLISLNILHALFTSHVNRSVQYFFLLDSIGQTLLEIVSLIYILYFLKKWLKRPLYLICIGVSFLFLVLQTIEFFLIRIMDVSLKEGLEIAFGADWNNFIELLYLTEIRISTWLLVFASFLIIPCIGVALYVLGEKLSKKTNRKLSHLKLIGLGSFGCFALVGMEWNIREHLKHEEFVMFQKNLPFKKTLTGESYLSLQIKETLLQEEKKLDFDLPKKVDPLENQPNIFLFIAESLRDDYIVEEYAPHLTQFSKDHIRATHSFSNANATHISWFSIFYSQYALYWSYHSQKDLKRGAPPLRILKDLGYKINIYSSAELNFYNFETTLLGPDQALCDRYYSYPHHGDELACDSDLKAIDQLTYDIQDPSMRQGQVFIIFLDGTHFDYSWPKDFKVPFDFVDELSLTYKMGSDPKYLTVIKNHYKNSIAYLDYLFSKVTDQLKSCNLYEESIMIFTGDHGEEFKEQGKLFHASNLNDVQTRVPLYYKFGDKKMLAPLYITSHVDIFPSLIHYLTQEDLLTPYCDGQSIFKTDRHPFVLASRYNSHKYPKEFYLHDGVTRIDCGFSNGSNIYNSTKLKIFSKTQDSSKVAPSGSLLLPIFTQVFNSRQSK